MDRDFWVNFLNGIEDFQVFSLCEHFDSLSLNDTGGSTNRCPRLFYDSGLLYQSFRHSIWIRSINEQLRAPFIELPRHFISSSLSGNLHNDEEMRISLGFRFHPGHNEFIINEF